MNLVESLAVKSERKILLVVLDGLGGLPKAGKTELETAWTPNLNRLAAASGLGLLIPVGPGIIPGSGPAHLALFGYDPVQTRVGRGVLEALGVGLLLGRQDLCARANFCTVGPDGEIVSRRAAKDGERLATEKCVELCARLGRAVSRIEDVEVVVRPGREHRFVVMFQGPGLGEGLTDSDPGREAVAPEPVRPTAEAAGKAARIANEFIRRAGAELAGRDRANFVLLRGLALPPTLSTFPERYKLTPACVAAYPMYRGLARLVGMEVLETGESWEAEVETVRKNQSRYDFFFLHLKELDKAGEDGDFDRKVELLERFDDDVLPRILALGFEVLCITGDHSTPAVMRGHSWHPVPFLLYSEFVRPQMQVEQFAERACVRGNIGYFPAKDLMALLLAHGLKLTKFGA